MHQRNSFKEIAYTVLAGSLLSITSLTGYHFWPRQSTKVEEGPAKVYAKRKRPEFSAARYIAELKHRANQQANNLFMIMDMAFPEALMHAEARLYKQRPLLDIDSVDGGQLILGPMQHPIHNFAKKSADELGLSQSIIANHIHMTNLMSICRDPEETLQRQGKIKALTRKRPILASLVREFNQIIEEQPALIQLLTFRDNPWMGHFDRYMNPERMLGFVFDVEKMITRKETSVYKEYTEQNTIMLSILKFIDVPLAVCGLIESWERFGAPIKNRITSAYSTVKWGIAHARGEDTHNYIPMFRNRENEDSSTKNDFLPPSYIRVGEAHQLYRETLVLRPNIPGVTVRGGNTVIYKAFNFFASRLIAASEGNYWGMILGTNKRFDYSTPSYSADRSGMKDNPISMMLYSVEMVFGYFYYGLLGSMQILTSGENAVMHVYNNVKNWEILSNMVLKQLKSLNNMFNAMKRVVKELESNDELAKIYAEELHAMKRFLRTRRIRKTMRNLRSVNRAPENYFTMWKILTENPFKSPSTKLCVFYKRLTLMPKGLQKRMREAFLALHTIEIYARIGHKVYRSSMGVEQRYYCFSNFVEEMVEDEEGNQTEVPIIRLKGARSIMVKGRAVANDFNWGEPEEDEAAARAFYITGNNGSGKTVAMESIWTQVPLSLAYGIAACEEAWLSHMEMVAVLCNITDDRAKGYSLLTSDAHRNAMTVNAIGSGPTLIIKDEPYKGTSAKDGAAILIATDMVKHAFPNTFLVTSTHHSNLSDLTKSLGIDWISFLATGYDREKGFTFKLIPGEINTPAYLHTLSEMVKKGEFDEEILDKAIGVLHKTPRYRFKDQLPDMLPLAPLVA